MSAVAYAPVARPRERVASPAATGPSLAALLSERWTAITSGSVADCMVCGSAMEPRWSAGRGIVGARCRSCGTSLD